MKYRKKVVAAAGALFAIGVAFAAQPTSPRADWGQGAPRQGSSWVPGTNSLMSAHEPSDSALAPPR
jgi:hypothetical protein